MPAYRWTCTACGDSNAASALACEACACPALASARDIATHRTSYVERGGVLQGDAALSAQHEFEASEVLGPVLLLMLRSLPGVGLLFAWLWG